MIFGSAPSVLDRWWSSRDSRLPRYNFVLHLRSPLPHETTLHIKKTLRASPRPVAVRLIAEQISPSGFLSGSLRNTFSQKPVSGRTVSPAVPRRTAPAHLDANPSHHSICIGPASAARAASFKSLYRKRAGASCSPHPLRRKRASDKALRLVGPSHHSPSSTGISLILNASESSASRRRRVSVIFDLRYWEKICRSERIQTC